MSRAALTTCPLCGHHFDPAGEQCHSSCPMAEGCRIICCPHCGYQMVDETRSTTVALLRGLWRRVQRVESSEEGA